MNDEEKIREIFKRLNEIYTIRTFHDHDPYKVLVRTILSHWDPQYSDSANFCLSTLPRPTPLLP